jgi:hypothetical protein
VEALAREYLVLRGQINLFDRHLRQQLFRLALIHEFDLMQSYVSIQKREQEVMRRHAKSVETVLEELHARGATIDET